MMTRNEIESQFALGGGELDGATILASAYSYEDYSGSAMIIFEKDGKLYEVHGSHCSCNGLEGQWEPEETSVAALQHRLESENAKGYYVSRYGEDFLNSLIKVVIGELFEKEILK